MCVIKKGGIYMAQYEKIAQGNWKVTIELGKEPNKIWCTDFTYLIRPDGTMRYNCTIIDLCGREAVASLNSSHIDTELAKETLKIALERRKPEKGIILHSD